MEIDCSVEIERLRTILRVESQRNYADTAVIGGLDKFLHYWSQRNKTKLKSRQWLIRFNSLEMDKNNYAGWNNDKRQLWIKEVLQFIDDYENNVIGNIQVNTRDPIISTRPIDKVKPSNRVAVPANNASLDIPVTAIKGVKDNLSAKLKILGVSTIRDLLYLFPRRHLDYSQKKNIVQLIEEEEQTIIAHVWESRVVNLGGRRGTEVTLGDETGNIRAIWFNQPYLANRFTTNSQLVISGKVTVFRGNKQFESPEWELFDEKDLIHTGRLVPVYPLTSGLYSRQLRNIIKRTVDEWANKAVDFLPDQIKKKCSLIDLDMAITQAHYPDSHLMANEARKRLAFDELFLIQLGVLKKKNNWQNSQKGNAFEIDTRMYGNLIESLPFKLTSAQEKVLNEIIADLNKPIPMSRILQGDVGSGKTIIAMIALLIAVNNGFQGALMAPTEILAEQHYNTINRLLSDFNKKVSISGRTGFSSKVVPKRISFVLLTSKITEKDRAVINDGMQSGNIDIVIGTHALIQKGIEFKKLGLAIVDEQHRFGVLQRSALRQKGFNPHLLVMTATPIPRTLALTIYGDLDLSVIDELPPGRKIIITKWIKHEDRDNAYNFVRAEIIKGHQAFIICPLIEESDKIEAKAATAEHERLSRDIFPEFRVGLLHGRMLPDDKDCVMQQFRDGVLDILVSTPVVEVGIDVPNATVMLIEAADRFGLSQLHQFRGRVGRGESESYCLLLSDKISLDTRERLEAIVNIKDGFVLAEKDLELRGPGEFFGVRQSGMPDLRMAKLSDVKILEIARSEAIRLFESDPELKLPDNNKLLREIDRVWPNNNEWS